ncbi:aminotransferase class III-fold pyridoxal phosphate-dependent enzyme [Kribbella sp. NPDC056861]|uniref:aminotransferase class III-fold pyridoxal phosphate-dependent enzyme n=1 Tax=Kribbella sp. NPDC056861 TaxID=3154857 RepID=UPI0034206FB9
MSDNDVAVIGMSGRFPGAPDLEQFWSRLLAGDDLLTTFTDAELTAAGVPERVLHDSRYVRRSAVLPDAFDFDAEFFGYTRREGKLLDPQQRILLEVAWELLETIGYSGAADEQSVGVFAGASMNTYLTNVVARACDPLSFDGTEMMIANDKDYLTTRISYKLGLTGPSVNVQSGCSTSLVAVHTAVQSLVAGECDIALAGGVSVIANSLPGYVFSEGMMFSPDGRCRPFDADASGTMFGDGVGLVALKRLAEAVEDGDQILAVVKGSAVNNDGSDKIGFTAPGFAGQRAVITEAHAVAGVDADTITLVEAHGTATVLGDPIEFAALSEVFAEGGARPGECSLGSVKANVGHLAGAAGIAGFIKALLALQHREIPGHPNFSRPNAQIELAGSPFRIDTVTTAWKPGATPRRAGVSSFGIGGTNAHVVLEEAPVLPGRAVPIAGPRVLAVSAKNVDALRELAGGLADVLEGADAPDLAAVAYTLRAGRRGFGQRHAVVADNHAAAVAGLRALAAGKAAGPSTAVGADAAAEVSTVPAVSFVFGEVSVVDFRALAGQLPAVAEIAQRSIDDALICAEDPLAARVTAGQVLATLWAESGARPESVGGTGVGEVLAACFSGVLDEADVLGLLSWKAGLREEPPVLRPRVPRIPILSAVVGGELPESRALDPLHWTRDVWEGDRSFTSDGAVVLTIGDMPAVDAALTPVERLLHDAARLWTVGVPVDWSGWFGDEPRRVPLPTHPLNSVRLRIDEPDPGSDADAVINREEKTVEPLLKDVVAMVGEYFDLQPDELDPNLSFAELGVDSMALLGMLRKVEDRFGCKVALRQLFGDVPTPARLAAYVADHAPADRLPKATQSEAVAVPSPVVVEQPTGTSSAVERLIAEQLLVMRRQLDVLAGSTSSEAAPTPQPVTEPVVPARSTVPLAPGARSGASLVETEQRAAYLKLLADRFGTRTKGSKEFAQRFRLLVADSRSSIGFRPTTKEMLYPIVADRGEGARLWDVDGNEYVDLTMGWGVHLLGHNPPMVMSALRERLDLGFVLAPRTELVEEVAAGLLELTGMERVAFLNTGTEAVMTALRIARVSTGRDDVVMFSTAYHGHADSVLAAASYENGELGTRPSTAGIPTAAVQNLKVLEFGSDEALEYIDKHGSRLAAVLTEPVALRNPGVQNPEFLRRVREITQRHGTKLVFDEMVTGFRCHPAGVQGLYGIEADLATYGKIIGGGMPLGVIAGRGGIMDAIDGGVWSFGDDSGPSADSTFFAGTFNQHPLSMVAAKAVLDHLRAEGPALQRDLDRKTELFTAQLAADFRELEVPIEVRRFSSMFRFEHEQNLDPLYFNLLDRGVFVWEMRNFFLSTAHEQADLDHIRAAVRDSVGELREHGVLGKSRSSAVALKPAKSVSTLAQRQLVALDEAGDSAYQMSVGFWLDGPLDRDALRGAVLGVVSRHEALRSTLGVDGRTLTVHPAADLAPADVLLEANCQTDNELEAFRNSWADLQFDLTNGPVFRAAVVSTAPERHLLLLSAHNAAVDGWSFSVVVNDLAELYNASSRGTSADLRPPVQFRDYVAWHDRVATGPVAAEDREYWHGLLKDAPTPKLPLSGKQAAFPYRAVRHSFLLDSAFCDQMRDSAREQGVTAFAYLVAAWGAVLHQVTGQDDLVVPVASARRPPELDDVVGYCSNLLPLRLRMPAGVLAADYVAEVLEQLVTGLESQEYPFANLIAELAPVGAGLRSDLFTTSISFYRQVEVPPLEGLAVSEAGPLPSRRTGHPLALNIVEGADGYRCDVELAADLLTEELAANLPQYYRSLLSALVTDSDRPLNELTHDRNHLTGDAPS